MVLALPWASHSHRSNSTMGVDPMQACMDQNDKEVWFWAIRGLFDNEFLQQLIGFFFLGKESLTLWRMLVFVMIDGKLLLVISFNLN